MDRTFATVSCHSLIGQRHFVQNFGQYSLGASARELAQVIHSLALRARATLQQTLAIGTVSLFIVLSSPLACEAQNPGAATPSQSLAAAQDLGFWDIVFSGGWIGITIMCSIIALSMIAFYLVVEQILTLRRNEIMPSGLADDIRQMLSQGRVPEADQLCRSRPSPLSFVLISGLSEIDFGWPSMEKAMEDAVSEQAAKLYRKIEYLSVIGNLAPMCGLLGTVTGMIFAFQQVAISQGTAGADDLAEGIYSALATTVAGLVVAIPSLGAFAVFRNRVDQLIAETAYLAQHVFSPLRRRSFKVAPRAVGPATAPPRSPT